MTEKKKNIAQIISEKRKEKFVELLAESGKPTDCAKAVGLTTPKHLYKMRSEDPDFAEKWDLAIRVHVARMEEEADRRGMEGIMEPVYYKGEVVGHKRNFSDQLLMFRMKGEAPEKYAQNLKVSGGIEGKFGVAFLPMTAADMESWERRSQNMHVKENEETITLDPEDIEDITDRVQTVRGD